MNEEKRTLFEKKILPILHYIGIIGASLMSVAYIICVFVLINGFKAEALLQTTIFACVNAVVGFVIMQFLKLQGVSFAENLPENQEVLQKYYRKKFKNKKLHSIKYFWATTVVKDAIIKCATLAITTIGVIYIVIQGSNDYNLLLLAFVNLIMFICFGFISLVKAYDFFNQQHMTFIIEKLKEEDQDPLKEEKVC